jgi:hypothetical protein
MVFKMQIGPFVKIVFIMYLKLWHSYLHCSMCFVNRTLPNAGPALKHERFGMSMSKS